MGMQEDITLWQYLADEAKAGRLHLDDSVAKRCRTAIDNQIEVYRDSMRDIDQMARVTGLGEFQCGKELAKLLGLKASDSEGDGDLDTALRDHIRVLELMGDTIQASLDRIQEQDTTNAQDFGRI
ncbi:hypothetical protein AB0L63_01320 [Nocardia sp. NPDC051990]|uniref:hypothetical protein n=1 Tax=Nocardia sp. NPDC051990 TaxID=3155285 RepID=UPI003412A53D